MSNQRDDEPEVYIIPDNFVDESRIFRGMFKTRNFIEGIVMAAIAALLSCLIPTEELTARITITVSICGPFFLLGVTGINGDTVFQTAENAKRWLSSRGVVLYNANVRALAIRPLDIKMEEELPKDRIIDYVEKIRSTRDAKRSQTTYIEGVDFEFEDDNSLIACYAVPHEADELDLSETGESSYEPMGTNEHSSDSSVNTITLVPGVEIDIGSEELF